jgi:hypothetical protein
MYNRPERNLPPTLDECEAWIYVSFCERCPWLTHQHCGWSEQRKRVRRVVMDNGDCVIVPA